MNNSPSSPIVTVIPAIVSRGPGTAISSEARKRVAAYARVSTDSDEQLTSYEAQVDYYTGHIKSKPEWDFIKVYADEGISATTTKRRDGFNTMIKDALSGKIDLILTKSVSRFARNTVDTLTTVRKLKEKGVEVYFEKENIYTMDSKGELLITIMSSLAQEESRSISENVTWGRRKSMADGKVAMAYKRFLGYQKGPDGSPEIVEEEAAIVRRIYAVFLGGGTYREIAATLTHENIPTPGNKSVWSVSTVKSILRNEKYSGNAILQKSYTVDYLTKRTKVNEGEIPQYFVENSHPAIVPPETYEAAQEEIRKRAAIGKKLSGSGVFSCRIVCADCGSFYGSKVWDSNNSNRRTIWQCNRKYQNEITCTTPHLTEDAIKTAFVSAFNRLISDRRQHLSEYASQISKLSDITEFDEQTARLEIECAETAVQAQEFVRINASTAQDQDKYNREYDTLVERHTAAKSRLETLSRQKAEQIAQREKLRRFRHLLEKISKPLDGFDEALWQASVETVTVKATGEINVIFRSGTEISIPIG